MSAVDRQFGARKSTSACETCGHKPNVVYQLYREVSNDTATWTDAAFWVVVGGVIGVAFEKGLEWLLSLG